MRKESKDRTIGDNKKYEEFYKLNNVFTLSFARRHIESRKQAEELIKELIHYSLADSNKSIGYVEFEINTDLKDRPTGFHIGFVNELPSKLYAKLIKNLRICAFRWSLGGREQFLVEGIREASEYFWKNTGVPTRHRLRIRRASRFRLTRALRQLEDKCSLATENLKGSKKWESCMMLSYNQVKDKVKTVKLVMNNNIGVSVNEQNNKEYSSIRTSMVRGRATC